MDSNHRARRFKPELYQLSYYRMAHGAGLEPATSGFGDQRSTN